MNGQYAVIGRLIARKGGATPAELIEATMSTSVHSRLCEMRKRGWNIWRMELKGRRYGRYFGIPPKKA